jgi:hypothetical protein
MDRRTSEWDVAALMGAQGESALPSVGYRTDSRSWGKSRRFSTVPLDSPRGRTSTRVESLEIIGPREPTARLRATGSAWRRIGLPNA